MKIEEKDNFQVKTNNPDTQLDTSIAFLQIPTKIKDQVKAYIDNIIDEKDAEKLASAGDASPFQSNGCFFVISLEQVEEIHGMLKKALDPNETDIAEIKSSVRQALTALQGQ